jgi:glutathione S-transferase
MMRLHDHITSGNGYKARLLLTQLGIPFERIEYDIDKGETRTPEFLAEVNANGRVPVLEVEKGFSLAESNAILCYLAEGTRFLPDDRRLKAEVMQWLFFEQYSHEPNVATPRYWIMHKVMNPAREALLPGKIEQGYAALGVMERHLAGRTFFVAERYTIADIALYAYTHVAPEGGLSLEGFPAVRAWLARIAAQPGHIPITQG